MGFSAHAIRNGTTYKSARVAGPTVFGAVGPLHEAANVPSNDGGRASRVDI